jgi:iron complex transport system ATP-binding protein
MTPALEARDVTVTIGGKTLVDRVSLKVRPSELLAIVGPNGAGKSTLVSVLAGDRSADDGSALVDGVPIGSLSRRDLARRRAVLPQGCHVAFPFRTEQVVMMGRYPLLRRGHLPGPADHAAVASALRTTDTVHLAQRTVPTLSGGEQARVSLARVLAQDAPIVLLDEPSAALDLRHQQQVIRLCLHLAAEGRAVVAIVHDLNQAAAADRVAVLHQGRLVVCDAPAHALTPTTIAQVFGVDVDVTSHPSDGRPVIHPADYRYSERNSHEHRPHQRHNRAGGSGSRSGGAFPYPGRGGR